MPERDGATTFIGRLDLQDPERLRLADDARRRKNWKRWGPYLAERAWGTVREDYSAYGSAWSSFPHEHARSRVYRWNEDGWPAFVIVINRSALPSRYGMGATRY